jgi:hypothetical protein
MRSSAHLAGPEASLNTGPIGFLGVWGWTVEPLDTVAAG